MWRCRQGATQIQTASADSPRMHGGMAFEALLDERLAGFEGSRHQSRRPAIPASSFSSVISSSACSTAATYGFFFLDSSSRSIVAGASPAMKVFASVSDVVPRSTRVEARGCPRTSSVSTAASKPARRMAHRRRAAIEELLALGASIGEDASSEELRTAFRTLARRYHPDSHAGASAGEKTLLARQFARLCEAYRAARNL